MSGGGKVPVFATVANAYAFALGDFFTVLRLSLLPTLAIAVTFYVVMTSFFAALPFPPLPFPSPAQGGNPAHAMAFDPNRMIAMMRMQAIMSLVAMIGGAMAIVPLMRAVLYGERHEGWIFYLRFGLAEVRVIFAAIVVQVLVWIAMLPMLFVVASGAAGIMEASRPAAGAPAAPEAMILIAVLAALMAGVLIWLLLRLYLFPAVAVAMNSLGLAESWELMRGNVLRMFIVLILVFVPFAMLAMWGSFILFADHVRQWGASSDLRFVSFKDWVPPAFAGLIFLELLFGNAFIVGIIGNAYLALTREGEAEPAA